jgi:hypothetical protein
MEETNNEVIGAVNPNSSNEAEVIEKVLEDTALFPDRTVSVLVQRLLNAHGLTLVPNIVIQVQKNVQEDVKEEKV